jgi:hypothetical protein
MNVELLRQVVEEIEREGDRRFDMKVGISKGKRGLWGKLTGEPCGTVCCLAGATYIHLQGVPSELKKLSDGKQLSKWRQIKRYAEEKLEITNEQGTRLFFVDEWPKKFQDLYSLDHIAALKAATEDFIFTDGWTTEVTVSIEGNDFVEHTRP